jgi:hypothetical protein
MLPFHVGSNDSNVLMIAELVELDMRNPTYLSRPSVANHSRRNPDVTSYTRVQTAVLSTLPVKNRVLLLVLLCQTHDSMDYFSQ